MRSKKRKAALFLAMLCAVFSFAACGEAQGPVDYNGYSYEDLQGACQDTAMTLENMSPVEAESYIQGGSGMTATLVESWMENRADLGAFLGFGEFEITKSGKTLTAAQTLDFEVRPMILTYVFNYNTMTPTDITVDLVYTTGEKMRKAGLNTVMCICVVFAVLVLISLVISSFSLIPKIQASLAGKPAEQPAARPAAALSPAPAAARPAALPAAAALPQMDEGELVAVITAAIAAQRAAETGSTDGFVVRSIRRR